MFNIGFFKSKWTRAVEEVADYIPKLLDQYGKMPSGALRDPYCLGFLQIVGVHVASRSMNQNTDMHNSNLVFEEALKRFAPSYAVEVSELLSLIRENASYLRGKKDGDLYMGWKLLHLAPQRDGKAALERFFDRVRYIGSPPPKAKPATPVLADIPLKQGPSAKPQTSGAWQVENKSRDFNNPSKEELSRSYCFSSPSSQGPITTLRIVCSLEASLVNNGEGVALNRRLRFYLDPLRLPQEVELIMRFATSDGAHGRDFDVIADHVEGERDTAMIAKFGGRSDVSACVAAIRSGKEMSFTLRNENGSLANFDLPNDREFERLYDETFERLKEREVLNEMLRYNTQLQAQKRE